MGSVDDEDAEGVVPSVIMGAEDDDDEEAEDVEDDEDVEDVAPWDRDDVALCALCVLTETGDASMVFNSSI